VSEPSERRPDTDGDHGGAIISEAREAVERPSVWEEECNLRVKRQDPLPKANDRWRKQSMPTLGYRNGRRDLNHYRSVFGLWVSADKRKTEQRSLTQQSASVKNWYQVPLWDRNVSQSFLRHDAASGNWQPTITRRVMRAPNASESGKESVASSHTSPFYKIFGFDNR
jgi:type II secretory pathway component PulJ